jgi:PAS domain S-box-containing protein
MVDESQPSDRRSGDVRVQWQRFLEEIAPDAALRPVILDSWRRSRAAGVDPMPTRLTLRQVPAGELEHRLVASAELLAVARPHIEWLSSMHAAIPHVAYLVDRNGVVLYATGTDPEALHAVGLLPGYDWSEATMGTNGAGTAIVAGAPVAVEGPEHYVQPLQGYTCTGAPVRGPGGDVLGAVDFSSAAEHGSAERLLVVAHAAYAIGQELGYRDSLRRTSGALEAERRLAEESARRVAALEALRTSEQRFRALIENAADPVGILDKSGTYRYVSPAHERVLGYAPEELLGESAFALVHPEDVAATAAAFQQLLDQPDAMATVTCRKRHKAGSWRTLAVVGRNLLRHPAVRGIVVNATDVTERNQLEAQLRHAQKMEAVGQLAGGVAHEINNALQAVVGFSAVALEQLEPNAPARSDVDEAQRAASRAATVAMQLLAFSRRQVLRPVALDLNGVLASITGMLRRALGPERQLVLAPAPTPAGITADPGQLEQVFLNLVLNARDAMPTGGRVTIALEHATTSTVQRSPASPADLAPGRYVVVAVTDTGTGMDEATRSHMFEPFFTTKPVGQGTGLGLAVVHGIVRQSGGHIDVSSAPGRGSTFTLWFPALAASEEAAGPVAADSVARSVGGRGQTVLVVDDDELVCRSTERLLHRHGYQVLTAPHGWAALEQIEAARTRGDQVVLVITDVAMPVMNGTALGRELARRVATGALPATPVLYTSGYAGDEAARRGDLRAGDPFIAKPFEPAALLRVVEQLVPPAAGPSSNSVAPGAP